jgi:hypothetical protein
MKKWVLRILLVLMALIVLVVLAVHFFLDTGIKRGVEAIGPKITKVSIKLDSVSLSLLSGSGKIKGLLVGNPEGFKTPSAIEVGTASLALQPSSLLADKVVIHSVNVQGPEITYETDFKMSNLKRILANVEAATGGGGQAAPAQTKEAKPGKKLQVDDFAIIGGKIHLSVTALGGQSATVPLPDIHLTNLGQGPDGITAAELTQKVLDVLENSSAQAVKGAMANLGKTAQDISKNLGQSIGQTGSNAAGSVSKTINDLFKKK